MIDSHAHVDDSRFDDDRDETLARAVDVGVIGVINVGIDDASWRRSIALAQGSDRIVAAIGVHPQTPVEDEDAAIATLRTLATESRDQVVAIGEIGLDFHWDTVPHESQPARLDLHLDLALELDLPVIFHCRDAIDSLLAHLAARDRQPPGVFHCFEGGAPEAQRALELGYHVSFAGNVTYKNSKRLHEAARVVPSDRLLLETDCPYLSPVPHRGKRNEPSFVAATRDFLSKLRDEDPASLEAAADAATCALFRLEPSDRGIQVAR